MLRREFPILEYDPAAEAVINPIHEELGLKLPEKCIFAFLGGEIEKFGADRALPILGHFESVTKRYPVFLYERDGTEICLVDAPCGAAPATQILDWLIGYGVREILSAGSCGALLDLPENELFVPVRALRDEGTSYHYLPPARAVDLDRDWAEHIVKELEARGIRSELCTTWTTDGFYRETPAKIEARKEEGCSVVEMECAALASCARFRRVKFGMILFTADSLANFEAYDARSWGADSFVRLLPLLLDVI